MTGRALPLGFLVPALALLWAMTAINGLDPAMLGVAALVSLELWLCHRTTRGEKQRWGERPMLSRAAVRGRVRSA